MPRFPSSIAHAIPVGPAPTITTGRVVSATRRFYPPPGMQFARIEESERTLEVSYESEHIVDRDCRDRGRGARCRGLGPRPEGAYQAIARPPPTPALFPCPTRRL